MAWSDAARRAAAEARRRKDGGKSGGVKKRTAQARALLKARVTLRNGTSLKLDNAKQRNIITRFWANVSRRSGGAG